MSGLKKDYELKFNNTIIMIKDMTVLCIDRVSVDVQIFMQVSVMFNISRFIIANGRICMKSFYNNLLAPLDTTGTY